MLRLTLLLLLVPLVLSAQPRRGSDKDVPPPPPPLSPNTYCNDRFSFGIDVPEGLIQQPPPTNGDGSTWFSADSSVEFRAWGENNAIAMKDMMAMTAERVTKTSVKRKGRDWFVVSGILPDRRILYHRTTMQNDVWVSFELVYPESKRKTYDPMCGDLAESIVTCIAVQESVMESEAAGDGWGMAPVTPLQH